MTLVAAVVAFGNALAWGGLDAARKSLVRDCSATAIVAALTLGQAPVFAVWAVADARWVTDGDYWAPGLVTLGLNVVANVAFVRALALSPLSLTIPFLSFTPVFTTLLAIPLVSEWPTSVQAGGIAVVVLGALALNAGGPEGAGVRGLVRALLRERGSVLMTAVAALWSVTSVLDKIALEHASLATHALIQTGGVGLALVVWLTATRRLSELGALRMRPAALGAAVAFGAVAIALQLWAIQLALVALVETIKRAVGMTMAVSLGRALFEEPLTAFKVVSVGLMALGTAALLI